LLPSNHTVKQSRTLVVTTSIYGPTEVTWPWVFTVLG